MNELKQVVIAFSATPCYIAQDTPGPYNQEELGVLWLDWVAELSANSIRNYELVLLSPTRTALPPSLDAWGKVTKFVENHAVAQWPQGPNRVFQQVLWFYYHKKLQGPFFWVEPDCMPLTPDWLDLVADEYRRCDKPFMGAVVDPNPPKNRAPRHMTGNAVYPDKAYILAPRLMEAHHTAWDVHAAPQILPKAHLTKLIQHDWRRPEIETADELRRILQPEAVLFHSDKYGAIPRLLSKSPRQAAPVLEPGEVPILEYAASRLPPPAGQGPDPTIPQPTPAASLDEALRIIQEASLEDPLVRKRIAKFMVTNDIVNHGHCTQYGKPFGGKKGAKYKTPAARGKVTLMTDAEFEKRIKANAQENVPATVTE
jgi:hypothetical protein